MINRCELIAGLARFAPVADYKTDVDGHDKASIFSFAPLKYLSIVTRN